MSIDLSYFEGSKNIKNYFACFSNNINFNKSHPYYFKPEGITIFSGSQGEGKTLSAVEMCKKILQDYPRCIFVTNLEIKGIRNQTFDFTGLEDLEKYNNEEYGVLFFIDEIQNYLNSLLSKDVPLSTIVNLTQQRKQRKLIIGTSQVYGRMAKPLREQVKNVVLCSKKFFFVQVNKLIDSMQTQEVNGQLVTVPKKTFIWFHSPAMYKSYDTYKKQYGLTKKPDDNKIIFVNSVNDLKGE